MLEDISEYVLMFIQRIVEAGGGEKGRSFITQVRAALGGGSVGEIEERERGWGMELTGG